MRKSHQWLNRRLLLQFSNGTRIWRKIVRSSVAPSQWLMHLMMMNKYVEQMPFIIKTIFCQTDDYKNNLDSHEIHIVASDRQTIDLFDQFWNQGNMKHYINNQNVPKVPNENIKIWSSPVESREQIVTKQHPVKLRPVTHEWWITIIMLTRKKIKNARDEKQMGRQEVQNMPTNRFLKLTGLRTLWSIKPGSSIAFSRWSTTRLKMKQVDRPFTANLNPRQLGQRSISAESINTITVFQQRSISS